MRNGIHFISGLPRSGSTLLAGILRQNPKFHAGMSSPVGSLVNQLLSGMGANAEFSVFIDEEQRRDVLRGVFDGYYRKIHPEQLVFDTNRTWCSRMPALATLFPEARIIACVRDPIRIVDSFERLIRKNSLLISRMFPGDTNATVYTRVDHLTSKLGTVGFAWNALQEAFYGDLADRLIVVDYEVLAKEPEQTMRRIYEFLNLQYFKHDFDNVSYEGGGEFDHWLGVPGLHTIGQKVRFQERKPVLPPEIVRRFANQRFWREKGVSKAKVLLPEAEFV
jgi:sulfotransferase